MQAPAPSKTVVLVGGGHTHVQVLRRWAMDPPEGVRVLVVLDRSIAVYSGMVPGFVAGDYAQHELEIDVLPLARRAGAGVILSAATDLDPVRREISIEGRPPIRYDVASLDVGSTVRGLELPGVREHALATRPIADFVRSLDARTDALARLDRAPRILVVGGGVAGTEIAFTLDARLRGRGLAPEISVVSSDDEIPSGSTARLRSTLHREARQRKIEMLVGEEVLRVEAGAVYTRPADSGRTQGASDPSAPLATRREADLVIWATGAAPVAFPQHAGVARLATDPAGFIEVRDTLQTTGFDDVFAVGDCARLVDQRWIPRAGVYAVRQGPVLEANLRARLQDRPQLRRYRAQKDFLSLLNLGGGRAIGSKWGWAASGRPIHRLKDWIDRRFMDRFQVLDAEGRVRPAQARLGAMGGGAGAGEADPTEMACGGCAAKLGAHPLASALERLPESAEDASVVLGLDARDDVAATRGRDGSLTLHNIDAIRAFCDDPYLVGRVAASNALSDLFATGGQPRHAQAIIALPDLPPHTSSATSGQEILFQTLSGIRSILDPLGVSLLGGHTTIGDALSVGLAVTGDASDVSALLTQAGARVGDDLLLSQPLGTGVVLAADMQGLAPSAWVVEAHAAMQRTNAIGGRLAARAGVRAATDVTGFGLAGHLLTLLDATGLGAEIERGAVPFLPGARQLWAEGLRSTAHPANREAFEPRIRGASEADEAWLFDPQTSGGLLLTVPPDDTDALIESFRAAGEPELTRIGRIRSVDGARDRAERAVRIFLQD